MIILTDKALYNVRIILFSKSLQRRIPYKAIKGVSYSNSKKFVIHGEKDKYDYYYQAYNLIDMHQIICILAIFYLIENKKSLKIRFLLQKNLEEFVTTRNDKKENINFSRMDEKILTDTSKFIINHIGSIKINKSKQELSEERDIKSKQITEVLRKLYNLIEKDYTLINRICLICLKDKEYNDPTIDAKAVENQESQIDFYVEKLINDIDEYRFNSLNNYLQSKECPHFFHDECKKCVLRSNFKCLLCQDFISIQSMYLFGMMPFEEFRQRHLKKKKIKKNMKDKKGKKEKKEKKKKEKKEEEKKKKGEKGLEKKVMIVMMIMNIIIIRILIIIKKRKEIKIKE